MATKTKETSHGKEKIGSSSSPSKLHHQHETIHGRSSRLTTTKSSIPTSPDKVHGILSTPNYLKHTQSSSKESSCKVQHVKKSVSNDSSSNTRFTRRNSFDKPPSPAKLQRTLSSNSSREKTPIKVSSTTPKKVISPRPVFEKRTISQKPVAEKTSISPKHVSERLVKTHKSVKTVQPTSSISKTLKRSSSITSSKNGAKSSPAASIASSTTAPTSPETIEIPVQFKVEQEDKVILVHEELEQDILKLEEDEEIPFELPPDHDQVLIDHHVDLYYEFPTNSEVEKPKILVTTPTLEDQELVISTTQIEEIQEKTIEQVHKEKQHEEDEQKEQVMIINEDNNNTQELSHTQMESSNLESESKDEVEPENEDETTLKRIVREENTGLKGEENKPFKLKFKQTKELEIEVQDGETPQKLKFKERETQDAKGKKETQAYNDVIEETASKLVEKRKNKVLALVGAFETVISLQEPEGQ